jgi:hypothetical protein
MGGMGENQKGKKKEKESPTCNYLEFSTAKVADKEYFKTSIFMSCCALSHKHLPESGPLELLLGQALTWVVILTNLGEYSLGPW